MPSKSDFAFVCSSVQSSHVSSSSAPSDLDDSDELDVRAMFVFFVVATGAAMWAFFSTWKKKVIAQICICFMRHAKRMVRSTLQGLLFVLCSSCVRR